MTCVKNHQTENDSIDKLDVTVYVTSSAKLIYKWYLNDVNNAWYGVIQKYYDWWILRGLVWY